MNMNDTPRDIMHLIKNPAPVATGSITKSLDQFKINDMKKNNIDITSDNNRQQRLQFTSKNNIKKQKYLNFLSQD